MVWSYRILEWKNWSMLFHWLHIAFTYTFLQFYNCLFSVTGTCFDVPLPCPEGKKFADVTDCTYFFDCYNGVLYRDQCREDYAFDIYLEFCVIITPEFNCEERCINQTEEDDGFRARQQLDHHGHIQESQGREQCSISLHCLAVFFRICFGS